MSKVTSKYQITLPRKVARAHRIEPGSEVAFVSSGESLRLLVHLQQEDGEIDQVKLALASFDEATSRQSERDRRFEGRLGKKRTPKSRGWSRDDLYADRIGR